MSRIKGRVEWFNDERGYGFIAPECGPDVFVHYSSICMEGFKTLRADDQVEFAIVQGRRGPQADQVMIVKRSSSSLARRSACSARPRLAGSQYLSWAKQRAIKYLLRGELKTSFAVMVADLGQHGQLKNHPRIELGFVKLDRLLQDQKQMRQWIDGFWLRVDISPQNSDQVQKAVGERIRNLRRNKGLSQKVLAELADLSTSDVRQIERGELDFGFSTVVTIAKIFDIPISRLFHRIA